MDQSFEATTFEMDHSGFENLKDQLLEGKGKDVGKPIDIRDAQKSENETKTSQAPIKKYVLTKGEQTYELDDDYELEMMADKKPVKLTLRELKDRAAGDIAVKNRMHSLAEEKKKVSGTFKQFTTLAKNDPLGALEFIAGIAKGEDSEFDYNQYLESLADQAEEIGKMDPKERKNLELEKKLAKAEQNLSQKERQQAVVLRKQELQADYPEIGDSQFASMVDAVLNSEVLLRGVENENDFMDKVEELIQETLTQRDIVSVINEINPTYPIDDQLLFSLSDQIRQNPDFDEEDVRDIVRELIAPTERLRSPQSNERERDIRTLSTKQRQAMSVDRFQEQSADPYQLLMKQLMERKSEKTPIYKR